MVEKGLPKYFKDDGALKYVGGNGFIAQVESCQACPYHIAGEDGTGTFSCFFAAAADGGPGTCSFKIADIPRGPAGKFPRDCPLKSAQCVHCEHYDEHSPRMYEGICRRSPGREFVAPDFHCAFFTPAVSRKDDARI